MPPPTLRGRRIVAILPSAGASLAAFAVVLLARVIDATGVPPSQNVTFQVAVAAAGALVVGAVVRPLERALARRSATQATAVAEDRFETFASYGTDLIWTTDQRGVMDYASPSVGRLAGLDTATVRGLPLTSLVVTEQRPAFEQFLRDVATSHAPRTIECHMPSSRGEVADVEIVGRNMLAYTPLQALLIHGRDVTDRNLVADRLRFDALHDALTGLPNRVLLVERVNAALIAADGRRRQSFAVMYVDLDGFKAVNDVLGHDAGDAALRLVSGRITQTLRIPEPGRATGPIRGPRRGPPADTLARIGGDEFVVLLHHVDHPSGALRAAERVQEALAAPFEIDGREVHINASIGLSLGPSSYTSAEHLVRDADIAMYRAKLVGDARPQIFDQTMHEAIAARLTLENELRAAIEREQFVLHFQPIFTADRRHVVGFEALVRWQHPQRGLLAPDVFLRSAEDTRLILPLGRWVLREACRQVRRWLDAVPTLPPNVLSVNLSALEILQPDAIAHLSQALTDTGVPSRHLRLELTESLAVRDPDVAVAFCKEVRALGLSVGVDDFGTGHCSLAHLRRLGVDYVKVDRTLLDQAVASAASRSILLATAMVAEALEIDVVFEGVEHVEQLDMLTAFSRPLVQGYLLAMPVPEVETWQYLRERPDQRGVL